MNHTLRSKLFFHGTLVLLLGMVVGFPYAEAISSGGDLRAWRMAHLEGVLNGLLLLAVAAGGSLFELSARLQNTLFATLLVVGYGNVLAATLAAASGQRGLQPGGPLANWMVFLGFLLAVLAVFVALALMAWGSHRAQRGATLDSTSCEKGP